MNATRDKTIDILRGTAIFTMVAANLAGEVLDVDPPFWFRLYGSFAAPLFILISGMMVAFTKWTKGHKLKYFLLRGFMIIIIGALVDTLIWKIYPFMSFEVLYLIGISIPFAYLFSYLSSVQRWIITISIILITPILQNALGYTDYPSEYYLWGEKVAEVSNETGILNHWIIDGWFPLFPWLGFSFIGVNLAFYRWENLSKRIARENINLLIGIIILTFGIALWWYHPGSMMIRDGYLELFYPPTLGYVTSAIGFILVFMWIVNMNNDLIFYKPLEALGESALFMYIVHLALIEYMITSLWPEEDFKTVLLNYSVLICLLISLAYGLQYLKTKWKDRPFIIRFLIG